MSLGGWGEGKNKKRAEDDGTGLPIVPRALTIPFYIIIFSEIPSGSLCGVGGGGVESKRSKGTFFLRQSKKNGTT